MIIGIIGCGKRKGTRPTEAQYLYTGTLFTLCRRFIAKRTSRWFILSAKHGLVDPGTIMTPYDLKVSDLTKPEIEALSAKVVRKLMMIMKPEDEILSLASGPYTNKLIKVPNRINQPLAGMAIGRRMQFLRGDKL